jgi:hypothetical protein
VSVGLLDFNYRAVQLQVLTRYCERCADAGNAVLPISHRRFTCVQFRLLHCEP